MFPQFGRLVSVSVMAVLVALLAWIYHRNRQQHIRLWMIGWSAIIAHFSTTVLDSFGLIPPGFADWLGLATLIAAASSFLLSVSESCLTSPRLWVFLGLLVAPALRYAALQSLGVANPLPYCLILALMYGAGFYLSLSSLLRNGLAGWAIALAAGCATAWTAWMAGVNKEYGSDWMLFAAFTATGYLFWRRHHRLSPGVVVTSTSFLLWGLVFPVGSLANYLHAGIPDDHVIWNLPKFGVAIGIILSLFEDQANLLVTEATESKQAAAHAEAASQAKSHFLAQMSHEIRTPMHGILGITELMLDGPLTSDQRESLELARTSAQSLLVVLNDVLDLSKIEAGKFELEDIDFNLRELILDTVRLMRIRAEQKGLVLVHEIGLHVPLSVTGDPGRLRQVLLNLLSNAIKFTERGRVLLTVEQTLPQSECEAQLRFSVTDSGIGIPADKRSSIFQPFHQADHSTARRFGGTGLGLTIASELVTLMGGCLSIDSARDGNGCIFWFDARFPVCKAAVGDFAQLAKAVAQSSSGYQSEKSYIPRTVRVLVAEDNHINQVVTTRLMEKEGYEVTVAASGEQAIAAWKRADFDVVLMDVTMPELDGYEATRIIRAGEQDTGRHVPIIAVTARAMKGDAEKCLAAGMDAYIAKPIQASELLGKIKTLI